jgi:hypothetical protein
MPLLLLSLLGCDTPPPPLDLSTIPRPLRECATARCAEEDVAGLQGCVEQLCPVTPAQWAVEPTTVSYSRADGILYVDVAVAHTPREVGGESVAHTEESWLGVTVLTRDGRDIDLAVQTVFPDQIGEPFTFSAEVGGEVQDIIFGLWGTKIDPCDVDRSGCRNFGFVLDDSLAAWPPGTYTEEPPRRQRILESTPTVMLQGAGAPTATLTAAMPRVQAALQEELARFGIDAPQLSAGLAETALPPGLQVLHRDTHDGPLASALAEALGSDAVAADPRLPADIVIQIGGSGAVLTRQRSACGEVSPEALPDCLATSP